MINRSKTTFSRIGAYELKANYQRNMLASTLLTAIIALIATFCFTSDNSEATPIELKKKVDTVKITIPSPSSIIIKGHRVPPVHSRKDFSVGIPVPIPDDELTDDFEDRAIATKNDLIEFINSRFDSMDIGDGNIVVYEPPDEDSYPKRNEFRYVEIYPEMIYQETPVYPRLARTARMEADVGINALVDVDGTVVRAVVYKSSGSNIGFDSAAVDAALLCKYSPGIQNGIPVPVWVYYKVEFRLRD